MKTLTFFTIAGLFLFNGLVAQSFEGTVEVSHSLHSGLISTFHIKNGQAVMEAEGPAMNDGMRTIIDPSTGAYRIITTTGVQTQVMTYNLNDPSLAGETPDVNAEGLSSVKSTGETKEIRGYQCEKYLVTRDGDMAEVWVAPSLSGLDITRYMTGTSLRREGKFLILGEVEGFVMEIHGTDKRSGKPYTVANTVKEGKVDDGKFVIPAEAKEIDMNQLKQQVEDAGNDKEKLKEIKQNLNQD